MSEELNGVETYFFVNICWRELLGSTHSLCIEQNIKNTLNIMQPESWSYSGMIMFCA